MELAPIAEEARLRDVARCRRRLPLHTGKLGRWRSAEPLCGDPALMLMRASTRLSQGRWLARLAKTAALRADGRRAAVVELGTCVGVSGMYLVAGLAEAGGGELVTFEGHEDRARLAEHHLRGFIERHGLDVGFRVVCGRFEHTVRDFFDSTDTPLDLVFVDGAHHYDTTLEFHRLARGRIAPRGIIVHDDIDWSDGMADAWAEIVAAEHCEIEELLLGGRPSRGLLYMGTQPTAAIARHHLDGPLERTLRRTLRAGRTG